jgi:penicillin-binding protein 2
MLIFDELKESDPQLRLVAVVLAAGLGILLAGLWWVQIVSAREYQSHLETQSYRTVRIPAIRGKILDREGRVLAENRPRYNLSLYLDDLRSQFQGEFDHLRPVKVVTNSPPFWTFWLGSKSVVTQRVRLKQSQIDALTRQARYNVANAVVAQLGRQLDQPQPLTLDATNFERGYEQERAMPYPILRNLNDRQIARFEENNSGGLGVDLELQSVRTYPLGTTAAHLLGYVQRDNSSAEGEDAYFSYRLPDYRGVVGVEAGFDSLLRGRAGAGAVLVNNLGYRQTEDVWTQPEPGHNVVLTIDLDIQQAAERSLAAHQGADARAAAVVMDVRTGDVLAMVSSPAFDPNDFAQGAFPPGVAERLNDPGLRPQMNRATFENYAPGSVFKTVIALAALENGLDPNAVVVNPENPGDPGHGHYVLGRRSIRDTAPPGDYSFKRAIERSCNTYFITVGLQAGIDNIVRMAEKFHFGERTGLPTRQETPGIFPSLARVHSGWHDGDTANLCIGQGEMAVTPIQMAVEISAIANGGKVLWPRLVERIEPQDPASGEAVTNFPAGLVRDNLGVHPRSLRILWDAMLGETEDAEGTGKAACVTGLHICGKTGTAQVQDNANRTTGYNYWFASFAPYETPRYAVMVMVQIPGPMMPGGGGLICAPIAHDIYEEILKKENSNAPKGLASAK